ncbi:MAG TPA: LuxR C-terminal-related transcriptional regulator [Ktedonobacteraceae bacterium]|nr:LuxR C-terminal-related transcriptional regulator [Ktedonobacteraceae bacterium]
MQTMNALQLQEADKSELIRELSAMLAQISVLQSIARPGGGKLDSTDATLSLVDLTRLRSGLETLEQMARAMLYEARSAEDTLSLETLPDAPLAEALARVVDETSEALQLSSRVVFSGEERPLAGEIERVLYHIARDALSQVRQHSGARKLRFTLHYGRDEIVMSVEDDGVPSQQAALSMFADGERALPAPPFTAGENQADYNTDDVLFASLHNRVEQLGGSLEVITSVEHGVQVQASLPYTLRTQMREEVTIVPAPVAAINRAPTANPIRILVVDSLAVTRAGLRHLLESYDDLLVTGEAIDGVQAVSETAELGPQVVIMDAQLPGGQSLEALRQIKLLNPDTRVLLLTTLEREEYLYETLRAGADGYMLKDIAPDELAQAVRAVARGEVLVQPQIAGRLISRFGKQGRAINALESLTAREMEVLRLLARGLRNKEIAGRLYVSERTVNFHLANIYQKLNVSGRTEALSKAHEQGLLTA